MNTRTQFTNNGAFLNYDPYAAIKKAHAEGKKIQFFDGNEWSDVGRLGPTYICSPEHYRIKPEPAFQLPPCAPGKEWHRTNGWREGDLPQGWRPLVENEEAQEGDQHYHSFADSWSPALYETVYNTHHARARTRRPLTFEHAGKSWTWHRPGNPMPCNGEARVHVLFFDDLADDPPVSAKAVEWDLAGTGDIIGWRYADEKKTVPLGLEDVPPGSVLRCGKQDTGWATVAAVTKEHCCFNGEDEKWPWKELVPIMQINRSIPLTGKWDANAWEPCSKEVSA